MFLKHILSDELVEVVDLPDVINPNTPTIRVRAHPGDLIQHSKNLPKVELAFPSGEPLPQCWIDIHYYEHAAA